MNRELRNQLIWSFYIPSILVAIAWGLMIPVLPVFARSLTSTYMLVGVLLASESIGRVLFDLPAGAMIQRYGDKFAMLVGLWLSVVSMALMVFAGNIWIATLLLVLSGAGLTIYSVARHAYITQVTAPHIRGRTLAIFAGMYRMGKFIGPFLGGWLGENIGLPAAFLMFSALTLISVVFVCRYMEATEQAALTRVMPNFKTTIQDNRTAFTTAGIGQVFAQTTRLGWQWLIPLYAADVLNLDVQTIGIVVGVGASMDALLFYTGGILMDRVGRKWAIVPAFLIQGLGVALIPFTGSAFTLALVAGLIGAGNSMSSGTMMTLGGDFAPLQSRGEFLGVWRFIGDFGMVGGPLVVGGVAQLLTLSFSVLAISGVGFWTAAWFVWRVPETLRRT